MKGKVTSTKKKSLLYFSVFPLILLLCLCIGCDSNGNNVVNAEQVYSALDEIDNKYTLACNTGDVSLYMSLWDDNGIRMAPDTPAVQGKDQIKEQIQPGFELFDSTIDIKKVEVQLSDDWAFKRGTYTMSYKLKSGGETAFADGKFLTILKKQNDGTWKIYCDCFNSSVPPE